MENSRPNPPRNNASGSSPSVGFCYVEKRRDGQSRHFVVHAHAPRIVVEVGTEAAATHPHGGVIRSVRLPNSWTGDYHRSGALLGPAVAFIEQAQAFAQNRGAR